MNGSAVPFMRSAERDGLVVLSDPEEAAVVGARLFAQATRVGVFGRREWYRTVARHGLAAGASACFAVWPDRDDPTAIFPMQRLAGGGLQSLTTPYTCLYAPLLDAGLDTAAIGRAGLAFGRFCRRSAQTRLDALDVDWPGLEPLLAGMRHAGLLVQRFDHFGNWHEPVAGLSWRAYLDTRPGALRETVRRKLKKAERDPAVRIDIVAGLDGLDDGIDAFESVYRRSWKEPEPFPEFNAGLMREMAPLGLLRLGILRVDGEPVAAQMWLVENRRAMVLKLAHDEAYKAVSPGTVLTAAMLRRLLDEEAVGEIDFGRGDDPYKRQWAGRRRQRIGVILVNPLRPGGWATLGRHALGQGRRAARSLVRRDRQSGHRS